MLLMVRLQTLVDRSLKQYDSDKQGLEKKIESVQRKTLVLVGRSKILIKTQI